MFGVRVLFSNGKSLALCLAAFLTVAASPADIPAPWSRPQRPFHVVGPIYYVGTEGIAAYLIQTRAGLILLDGGLEESVPLVERNITALGFKLRDVKLMIATHAHYDHVAALAGLKRDTGAAFLSSPGDRRAYETGTPPSEVNYGVIHFPAIRVDRVLTDGRPVTLGDVSMTPVFTPGHTPGCTSWTMRVTEAGRPLDVVFLCSLTVAGNKLIGNKGYPGIAADYRRTFARVKRLHADVVLPGHSEQADVIGRAQRRDAGDVNAFVDPALLPRILAESEAGFAAALKKEQGQ
jgi:metallo-beta-lactamase class B